MKETFPETFKSQWEKNKNVIHWPRSVLIGRNCALGLSIALGLWPQVVLKTSGTVSPKMDFPAGKKHIFMFVNIIFHSVVLDLSKILLKLDKNIGL